MSRYRAGTYLSETNAKAYVLAAGGIPDKVLAETHPIRIEGRWYRHCMWCYNLMDIQMALSKFNISKRPDEDQFLTRWQRYSKRKRIQKISLTDPEGTS